LEEDETPGTVTPPASGRPGPSAGRDAEDLIVRADCVAIASTSRGTTDADSCQHSLLRCTLSRKITTRLNVVHEELANENSGIVTRRKFEDLKQRAAIAILQSMRSNIFQDRVKLQDSLAKVKDALRALKDCRSDAELERVVGKLHGELPTMTYSPTSPSYSPFSPPPHLANVCVRLYHM